MPTDKHQRSCRYGHGPLIDEPHQWFMHQFDPAVLQLGGKVPGDPIYVLRLAVCPVCGYVELFDPEEVKL